MLKRLADSGQGKGLPWLPCLLTQQYTKKGSRHDSCHLEMRLGLPLSFEGLETTASLDTATTKALKVTTHMSTLDKQGSQKVLWGVSCTPSTSAKQTSELQLPVSHPITELHFKTQLNRLPSILQIHTTIPGFNYPSSTLQKHSLDLQVPAASSEHH